MAELDNILSNSNLQVFHVKLLTTQDTLKPVNYNQTTRKYQINILSAKRN